MLALFESSGDENVDAGCCLYRCTEKFSQLKLNENYNSCLGDLIFVAGETKCQCIFADIVCALLPVTSKANKLPLETEPIAPDNNTSRTRKT